MTTRWVTSIVDKNDVVIFKSAYETEVEAEAGLQTIIEEDNEVLAPGGQGQSIEQYTKVMMDRFGTVVKIEEVDLDQHHMLKQGVDPIPRPEVAAFIKDVLTSINNNKVDAAWVKVDDFCNKHNLKDWTPDEEQADERGGPA